MVPHDLAVVFVDEEVDAVIGRPVRVRYARDRLGHDDGARLAQVLCEIEGGEVRGQEREEVEEQCVGTIDGVARRVVVVVAGEGAREYLRLQRQDAK